MTKRRQQLRHDGRSFELFICDHGTVDLTSGDGQTNGDFGGVCVLSAEDKGWELVISRYFMINLDGDFIGIRFSLCKGGWWCKLFINIT